MYYWETSSQRRQRLALEKLAKQSQQPVMTEAEMYAIAANLTRAANAMRRASVAMDATTEALNTRANTHSGERWL